MKDKEFEHIAPVLRQRSVDTARSLGLDADDAEDVAQYALLRLWSLRGELHVGRVEALVVTMARNLSIDIHRRRRTVPMDSRPIIDELHTQPDTLMEVADDERRDEVGDDEKQTVARTENAGTAVNGISGAASASGGTQDRPADSRNTRHRHRLGAHAALPGTSQTDAGNACTAA